MKRIVRFFFRFISIFSFKRGIPDRPSKILVLMCNWLGDTFWAMQVLPALKERFPDADIFVAVKPFSKHLLHRTIPEDHILIERDIVSDRRREEFSLGRFLRSARAARREGFDLGIDLTCNRYSASFLFFAGIPSVGVDVNEAAPLYDVCLEYPENGREHYRKRSWRILEPFGLAFDHENPRYIHPAVDIEAARREYGLSPSDRTALLLPGAGWPDKEWAPENFSEIGRYLEGKGMKVIVSGSPKERELCERIAVSLESPVVMIDDLPSLLALIPHLCFAISNDSGVAHLVAAAGVPLAVVFISTDPATCAPIGERVRIFDGGASDIIGGIKEGLLRNYPTP